MGFKDIKLFNQALLAKQAWRVLHYPDCLLSRLLKSRYFPHRDFIEAGLVRRPSFGWRSLLFGRELLMQGLVKRVGNGASIKVWGECWIDDKGLHAPLLRNQVINIDMLVTELIDFEHRRWDKAKLEELFYPEDVRRILVHKPVTSKEDFFVWKPNKNGFYSVKSGYWLACQINKVDLLAEASMEPSLNGLKEQVWSLQTTSKIQNFLWKMLSGAVPVTANLMSRGLRLDERCQICGFEEETINHVIFNCSLARQIWALSNFPSPRRGFEQGLVYSNLNHLLANRKNGLWPEEIRKSFPWIIWRIWKNRNSFVFEGKSDDLESLVGKIKGDMEDWFAAQQVEKEDKEACPQIPQGSNLRLPSPLQSLWIPPPTLWVKCNIGFSWSRRNQFAGGSWVVRDDAGMVLLHSRRAFVTVVSVEEAKYLCFCWAIESMISHKLTKVIFALEDGVLVGVVNRPKAWPSFGFQAVELGNLLSVFEEWKVEKGRTESNRGANLISQSVTLDCRMQPYVASNHPLWLTGVFDYERVLSSS